MLLTNLLDNNRAWAARILERDPDFFKTLSKQQSPEYFWIGCSDSRVPANEIIGLPPGEVFVHRNVANLVVHTDLNCLSVIHFAVDILKVKHIMVVGHYGCSGVRAAFSKERLGLSDNWLRHVRDIEDKHTGFLHSRGDVTWQLDRLCELNAIEQVVNVCQTTIVEDAWARGAELAVHGWVYGLKDGLIHDLKFCISSPGEAVSVYRQAVERIYGMR